MHSGRVLPALASVAIGLAAVCGLAACGTTTLDYKADSSLFRLPTTKVDENLTHSFPRDYANDIVGGFSLEGFGDGAVAVRHRGCAVSVEKTDTGPSVVTTAFPLNSNVPLSAPHMRELASRIGKSTAVGFSLDRLRFTVFCGLKGMAVEIRGTAARVTTSGSVVALTTGATTQNRPIVLLITSATKSPNSIG
jgi:hypothetical protein